MVGMFMGFAMGAGCAGTVVAAPPGFGFGVLKLWGLRCSGSGGQEFGVP